MLELKNIDNKIKKILNSYPSEYKKDKSSSKKFVFFVKAKDKNSTQKSIEDELTKNKFAFGREKINSLSGSSLCTVIDNGIHKVIIVYKPASGGMQETTLNSTITELAPALAFTNNYKPKTVEDFYSFLKGIDHKTATVYVNDRDREAGKTFIDNFPTSSKFKEKMKNAMGVLDYLYEENSKKSIKKVYWGYRAKPVGIDSSHKGDLFIQYNDNKFLGVSLKAGEEKSSEPKLNTYVNPVITAISNEREILQLREELFDKVYSFVGCSDKNNYDKTLKKDTLLKLDNLENSNLKRYEELYDTGLNIIRTKLTELFDKDTNVTLKWIQSAILGEDSDVPLIVVKAYDSSYKILTDDDDISIFLPKVKSIKSYPSKSSKQDFFIELIGKSEKLTLKFAVRTNKTGNEHKLGQFFNLAVKFNGIV